MASQKLIKNNTSLVVILTIVLLGGCATKPSAPQLPILQDRVVHVDNRLLQECQKLTALPVNATFNDVLEISLKNMQLYSRCAANNSALIEVIKQFSGK